LINRAFTVLKTNERMYNRDSTGSKRSQRT